MKAMAKKIALQKAKEDKLAKKVEEKNDAVAVRNSTLKTGSKSRKNVPDVCAVANVQNL